MSLLIIDAQFDGALIADDRCATCQPDSLLKFRAGQCVVLDGDRCVEALGATDHLNHTRSAVSIVTTKGDVKQIGFFERGECCLRWRLDSLCRSLKDDGCHKSV